ncbi:MAG: 30S ribosomal protein S14 [Rhodospirillaceae bacterium]|nr:30S ribosomal protein S14 [Rhodospirillaceae bacterium]MYF08795.1 30S ribosomal protein S14 [Rhodospirillaceae bacterium]MYF85753.1 30S ribosomal protein S14 [Rhodospirillaceae bacterium]MYH38902.1 30S ribosomal protein S14 [Rhodospirillaceae bacterium]MYJ70421.1 30S ribosomal protein S14 [Rhodospirillaceae bacterium]
MAKKSAIEKNDKRRRLVAKFADKRAALRAMAKDASLPPEERFKARLKLNELPKNGAATRVRNRCAVSGRPRGYYRKFGISRIALRDLGSKGQLPGVVKSSW